MAVKRNRLLMFSGYELVVASPDALSSLFPNEYLNCVLVPGPVLLCMQQQATGVMPRLPDTLIFHGACGFHITHATAGGRCT